MRVFPALLLAVLSVSGCRYRMGLPGAGSGPVVFRLEVENRTGVSGLSGRFAEAVTEEAEAFPGVLVRGGADDFVRVVLSGASRVPVQVDKLGRAVEERMRLRAEVSSSLLPEVIRLDTLELTTAMRRARRSCSSREAEDAAFRSLARAVLLLVTEKGSADASL